MNRTFFVIICLAVTTLVISGPTLSPAADLPFTQRADTAWYETGPEEQNAFLLDYFRSYFQGNSYDSGADYSKTNSLYVAWRGADKDGSLASAPADARNRAAATFLRLKRNEIFARNGDKFNDTSLQVYFSSFAWYQQVGSFSTDSLTETELSNVSFLSNIEKKYRNDEEAAFYTHSPVQVKLSDGSSLKGNVRLRFFDFDSAYGKARVPVSDITEIRPGSGEEGFKVYLKNGDRITSSANNAKIPVTTLFGEVDLEVKSASQITLSQ